MNREQVSPDELTIEQKKQNELICEKLLGWKQSSILGYWFPSPCHVGTLSTPSFTTWAEAGLILEALQARRVSWSLGMAQLTDGLIGVQMSIDGYKHVATRADGPTAIRAAALEYIKVMKP